MNRGFGLAAQDTLTAEPLVKDEEKHRSKWVAVRKGDVLFEADSEADLLKQVTQAHLPPNSYVIRYINEPPSAFVVGVG